MMTADDEFAVNRAMDLRTDTTEKAGIPQAAGPVA
jgi:hypothetical protein